MYDCRTATDARARIGMKLERFERAKEFYERAEGFLIEHEACHSLMLGITRHLAQQPKFFGGEPYLATVEEAG